MLYHDDVHKSSKAAWWLTRAAWWSLVLLAWTRTALARPAHAPVSIDVLKRAAGGKVAANRQMVSNLGANAHWRQTQRAGNGR